MGGPDAVTGVLVEGSRRVRVRDGDVTGEAEIEVVQWREEPQTKECGRPLEGGKGKETDSPLEPPEGAQP